MDSTGLSKLQRTEVDIMLYERLKKMAQAVYKRLYHKLHDDPENDHDEDDDGKIKSHDAHDKNDAEESEYEAWNFFDDKDEEESEDQIEIADPPPKPPPLTTVQKLEMELILEDKFRPLNEKLMEKLDEKQKEFEDKITKAFTDFKNTIFADLQSNRKKRKKNSSKSLTSRLQAL